MMRRTLGRSLRAVAVGGLVSATLTGCGTIPVPGVLEPILGTPATYTPIRLCVVDLSAPRGIHEVDALREEPSGKLFLDREGRRQPLTPSAANGYAMEEDWFQASEPIRQYGLRYVKYGSLRMVPATSLTRGADHRGVPVFLDRSDTQRPAALYIPVEPGCIFQPYVDSQQTGD